MLPNDFAAHLCATCAGFDWASLLSTKGWNDTYVLHPRFKAVFEAASTGCRLCRFLVQRYWDSTPMQELVGNEGRFRGKVEPTKAYHEGCPVAVKAVRDSDGISQVVDLKMFLLIQEIDEKAVYDTGVPRNFSTMTGPISLFVIDKITAEIEFSAAFGVSVPLSSCRNLRDYCAVPSYVPLHGMSAELAPSRLRFVRKQLAECCDSLGHRSCEAWPGEQMPRMPTRVIDCRELRLVETHAISSEQGNISAPYAILSHCWGSRPGLKTTHANYEDMCRSIELQQLPATIRDAINFANMMEIRYIWIDSFCIIQSSCNEADDAKYDSDWLQELPHMHSYYQNAVVTFVIESAKGDHEGFLGSLNLKPNEKVASDTYTVPMPVKVDGEPAIFYLGYQSNLAKFQDWDSFFSRETPLRRRAWTLQEVVLSPRKIHIYNNELIWSCASVARHCEVFRAIQPSSSQQQIRPSKMRYITRHGMNPNVLAKPWDEQVLQAHSRGGVDPVMLKQELRLNQWYNYAADHQRRKVTYPSDKLPAISAVATDMARNLKHHYYAGIWIEDAPRGLAWRTLGSGVSLVSWRAPSWSWASLDCSNSPSEEDNNTTFQPDHHALTVFRLPDNHGTQHLLKPPTPLEVEAYTLSFDHWPVGWQIRIRIRPSPDDIWEDFDDTSGIRRIELRERVKCEFDCIVNGRAYYADDMVDVVLLRLGTWRWANRYTSQLMAYALMLRVNDDGSYSRVGFADIPNDKDWWEQGWERKRLTLV